MNSLQFSPFKDEIFSIFTFLRFFLGEKDKITLIMVNCFYFFFILVTGFFYLEFCVCVVWSQITRFLLGDLLTFFILKRVFFTIFTFLGFFGMKMDKKFSCNGECFKILIFA